MLFPFPGLSPFSRPRFVAGGGGGLPVSGCAIDFDPAAIVGLSNGDPAGTFTDTSGNANHGTASGSDRGTYETNAINSLPAVSLDGAANFYTWTPVTARTLYIVYNASGAQPSFSSMWGHSSNLEHLFGNTDAWLSPSFVSSAWSASLWYKDGTLFTSTGASSMEIASWHVISVVLDSDVSLSQMRDRNFAARVPYGKIARYIVFPTAHGTTARQAMEAYLATLFGL